MSNFAAGNQDLRSQLRMLGVDEYSATMMIQGSHLFAAPATTDLDMQPVIGYIRALQGAMAAMGAPVEASGQLDLPTAGALQRLAGPYWQSMPWFQLGQAVLMAADRGASLAPAPTVPAMGYVPSSGFSLPDLPAPLPGGLLGWALVGGAAYYFLSKR